MRMILCAVVACFCMSCTGTGNAELDLRSAEMAVAQGDMTAAKSIASHIVDKNLSDMPASQLCRLSIVYMQMADSTDVDNNVAMATKLYRKAYETDADSAGMFYSGLSPDNMQYAAMLSSLVGNIDNPYDAFRDSIEEAHADTIALHTHI